MKIGHLEGKPNSRTLGTLNLFSDVKLSLVNVRLCRLLIIQSHIRIFPIIIFKRVVDIDIMISEF